MDASNWSYTYERVQTASGPSSGEAAVTVRSGGEPRRFAIVRDGDAIVLEGTNDRREYVDGYFPTCRTAGCCASTARWTSRSLRRKTQRSGVLRRRVNGVAGRSTVRRTAHGRSADGSSGSGPEHGTWSDAESTVVEGRVRSGRVRRGAGCAARPASAVDAAVMGRGGYGGRLRRLDEPAVYASHKCQSAIGPG